MSFQCDHPAVYIRFSVMDVRTSRLDVLFLMFCARVKISSSWGWRCSRSIFVTCPDVTKINTQRQSDKVYHTTEFSGSIFHKIFNIPLKGISSHKCIHNRSPILTWRRPIVVLISSVSPTVTILDLSICVMRRSQSASSVAVSLRSVGATVSGVWGVWWWGSSLTRLAICTAEGTADTGAGGGGNKTQGAQGR